ncbi:CpsB/CapC family capsule biosynthesis tyrosine phosphatase, partial [Companilactobacillus alimentarius]
MKLIDLHCHILPGVDDGSKDMQMSLDLAKAAVDQG